MKPLNKLSKKLQHTYYSSNKKSFILNIDLDEINKKDISKNANKHDMELLSNLTDKKWKLLDKKRKLFKVKDEVSYNIQFREHDKKEKTTDIYSTRNNSKLAKFVFSGIAGVTNLNTTELPIINLDLKKVPEKIVKKLKVFEIELDDSKHYSVEITEHFYKMIKLNDFLKENNSLPILRAILFYIFLTMYNYKKIYPNFQHNSLNTESIYVYLIEKNDKEYSEFIVDGVQYVIPNIGCEVKVSCFENCNFNESVSIKKDVEYLVDDFKHYDHLRLKTFIDQIGKHDSFRDIIFDSFFNEFKKPINISTTATTTTPKAGNVDIPEYLDKFDDKEEGDNDREDDKVEEVKVKEEEDDDDEAESVDDDDEAESDDDDEAESVDEADKDDDKEAESVDEAESSDVDNIMESTEDNDKSSSTESDDDSEDGKTNNNKSLQVTKHKSRRSNKSQNSNNGNWLDETESLSESQHSELFVSKPKNNGNWLNETESSLSESQHSNNGNWLNDTDSVNDSKRINNRNTLTTDSDSNSDTSVSWLNNTDSSEEYDYPSNNLEGGHNGRQDELETYKYDEGKVSYDKVRDYLYNRQMKPQNNIDSLYKPYQCSEPKNVSRECGKNNDYRLYKPNMDRKLSKLHESKKTFGTGEYNENTHIQEGGSNSHERNLTDSDNFFFLNNQTGGGSNQIAPQYENDEIENIDVRQVKQARNSEKVSTKPPKEAEPNIPYPFLPLTMCDNNPFKFENPNILHPIVKNYSINAHNPLSTSSLEMVNHVYQDYILPHQLSPKNSSIDSRLSAYSIIRNLILNKVDGKEIHMASKNNASILSYIKVLEGNPYHYSKETINPYKTNPFDRMIVKCGYPIRYGTKGGYVALAQENVSINLRIYRLDNAEYHYPVLDFLQNTDLEPWRELLYYQFILTNIIEQKVSPHFVFLYGYFLNKNKIDFDKLNQQRDDDARLLSYKYYKRFIYEQLLRKKELLDAPDIVEYKNNKYNGAGVLLINRNNTLFLLDDKKQFSDIGGKIRSSFQRSVIDNVSRKTNYEIKLNSSNLDDSNLLQIDDSTMVGYKYGSYVLRVDSFPRLKGLEISFNNIDEVLKDTRLNPRLKTLLIALKDKTNKNPDFLKNLKLIDTTTTFNINRDKPKDSFSIAAAKKEDVLAEDSKTSLLILTESPTHSLLSWTSRKYDSFYSTIKKMEQSGIHSESIWNNILFQMIQAFHTMQSENFCIRNIRLEYNIFIKDLPQLSDTHWIYLLGGVKYYVPNVGYLVMFDIGGIEQPSVYSNVLMRGGVEQPDFSSNVSIPGFSDNNYDIQKDIWASFLRVFNPTNFTSGAMHKDGNMPPKSIINLLQTISSEALTLTKVEERQILPFIHKHFYDFFHHPRIGTQLTDMEKSYLSNTNKNFKSGELVAYRDYSENILDYIWAVILFINGNNADIKYYNNTKVEICQKTVSINAHLQKYIRNKFIDNDVTYDRYEKINPNKLSYPADKILDVYIS